MDRIQQGKEKRKMRIMLFALLLVVNTLLVDASFTVDREIIFVDISKDNSEIITVNIENSLEENLSLEIGIAGKAAKVARTKEVIELKSKEKIPLLVVVKTLADTEEGFYRGDLVLSSEDKTILIPLDIKVKDKLKDSLNFNIVPSTNSLAANEEMQVLVQFDYTDDKEFEGTLTVSLFSLITKKKVLEVGDTFLSSKSFTKKLFIYIPSDIPGGEYRIVAEADTKRANERWIFTAIFDIRISGIEQPAPEKGNYLFWIIIVFIITGFFVLGTQVYHFEYVFKPWEKVEIMKKFTRDINQEIKESDCYIIDERGSEESFKAFIELVGEGYKGLVISRINPQHLRRQYNMENVEMRWLSAIEDRNVIGPTDIEGIHDIIEEFVMRNEKSVVLLDGLQYLVVNVSLEQVTLMLEYIKDRISTLNSIFIAPVNLNAFDREQRETLTSEVITFDAAKGIVAGKKSEIRQIEKKLEVPDTLVSYIKTHLDREHPKEFIAKMLVGHGWPNETVNEAFRIADEGKGKINKELEEKKKEAILFEEEKIEKIVDEMMSELTGEEEKEGETEEQIEKIEEEKDALTKVKDDLVRIKHAVTEASGKGLDTSRLEMQLSLLTTDLQMARITEDKEHLNQIKKNITDIEQDLRVIEDEENKKNLNDRD